MTPALGTILKGMGSLPHPSRIRRSSGERHSVRSCPSSMMNRGLVDPTVYVRLLVSVSGLMSYDRDSSFNASRAILAKH